MPRALLFVPVFAMIAGCSITPRQLGLTGAPQAAPPAAPSDATIGVPGISTGTNPYTPTLLPQTGGSGYFGYRQ
jgi:hypothetical protein